jgi:hypothetical protein
MDQRTNGMSYKTLTMEISRQSGHLSITVTVLQKNELLDSSNMVLKENQNAFNSMSNTQLQAK